MIPTLLISIHSDFLKSFSIQENHYWCHLISIICCLLCHLTFAWHLFTYAFLTRSSNLIHTTQLLISSYSCKSSNYWDQTIFIFVLLSPYQTCSVHLHMRYDMSLVYMHLHIYLSLILKQSDSSIHLTSLCSKNFFLFELCPSYLPSFQNLFF